MINVKCAYLEFFVYYCIIFLKYRINVSVKTIVARWSYISESMEICKKKIVHNWSCTWFCNVFYSLIRTKIYKEPWVANESFFREKDIKVLIILKFSSFTTWLHSTVLCSEKASILLYVDVRDLLLYIPYFLFFFPFCLNTMSCPEFVFLHFAKVFYKVMY